MSARPTMVETWRGDRVGVASPGVTYRGAHVDTYAAGGHAGWRVLYVGGARTSMTLREVAALCDGYADAERMLRASERGA